MLKKKESEINVSIFYGNSSEEISRNVNEKINGKKYVRLTEEEISGKQVLSPVNIEGIEIIVIAAKSILQIENFLTSSYIDIKSSKETKYTEIQRPYIVVSIRSFQPADISYFEVMENVELVPCFYYKKNDEKVS